MLYIMNSLEVPRLLPYCVIIDELLECDPAVDILAYMAN